MEITNGKAKRKYLLTFISRNKYCAERYIECVTFLDVIRKAIEICMTDDYKVIVQQEMLVDGVKKYLVVCEFYPQNFYQIYN